MRRLIIIHDRITGYKLNLAEFTRIKKGQWNERGE